MKLIVGLGNPGRDYENTRHNIGFMVLDALADKLRIAGKDGHKSLWGKGKTATGHDVILQKPLTYMNLSGEAIQSLGSFFKVSPADILVIHDELDLPFGTVRLKVGGGEGGHNGLKSTSKCLGTGNYARIRMGIGRPPHPGMDPADFVLAPFSKTEQPELEFMIGQGIEACEAFAAGTFQKLMNTFNQREKK